jgi:hypothetical protein
MKIPDPASLNRAQTALQDIVSTALSGDFLAAETAAHLHSDKVVAAEAWRLQTEVNANLQRWAAAEKSPGIALQLRPDSTELRLRHALLREQQDATRIRA